MRNRGLSESERIKLILKYLKKRAQFRYNIVKGKLEFKPIEASAFEELDDMGLNSLAREIKEADISCSSAQLNDILLSDITPKYDPFHAYLSNLPPWDGVDYIKQLSETVQTTNQSLWEVCLKKWLVAMVASLLNARTINHTVLILVGAQGIGKSTWILMLVPSPLDTYYFSGVIKLGNKDTEIMLSESMIIILEELSSFSNKELNELKEIITKPNIRIRRAYGRFHENLIRRASFIGSTNDKKILTDTTGNRRFLPFEVIKIDYEQNLNMDKIYSQAIALLKTGFKFYFDKEEIALINKHSEEFRFKSVEEEFLLQLYSKCEKDEATDYLTPAEILSELNSKFNIKVNSESLQRIGKALKANGFIKTSKNGKKPYFLKRNERSGQISAGFIPNRINFNN